MSRLRSYILGPVREEEEKATIADVYNNGLWQLQDLSITLQDQIQKLIQDFPMSTNHNMEDRMIWRLAGNGKFSLTSTYSLLAGHIEQINTINKKFNVIWKARVLNKIKIFLWTLLNKRLPTNHYLHSRGLNVAP